MLATLPMSVASRPSPESLSSLTPLLRELNDLKRVRAAHFGGSYADHLFVDAWRALLDAASPAAVAISTTARAVVATRLGAIDAAVLREHGLSDAEVATALTAAFDDVADTIPAALRGPLRDSLMAGELPAAADPPPFVGQLVRQPRAGATHPGRPRMVLEPAESHGDHCLMVAVYAVLVSPRFGGDPGLAFLAGLSHHLFNASLPDAGFNGDVVLGRAGVLNRVTAAAFDRSLAQLTEPALGTFVREAIGIPRVVDRPESRCFHAADVFDRVLEMAWFDKVARFRLTDAVKGLDIVHVAPEQAIQRQALTEAGIWHDWA